MNETGLQRSVPDQTSGSGHTFETSYHPSVTNTILSKRVCFYKSGDPQFSGLRVVINNRTFKTFDALLDSLSKKVPLPFGVRNITTPRGIHGINTLDDFEDGKSYICSDSRKVKPVDLALARRRLPPWYHARPVSSRHRTERILPGRKNIHREDPMVIRTPKKLVVFLNGDPSIRRTVLLHKKTTPSYESVLGRISELLQFHVKKLHTPDGQRIDGLPGLILCSGIVVAVGREPFRPTMYDAEKSPSTTRQPTKRKDYKRQKTSVSKKMTSSFFLKPRNFSASSERYIIQKIHNSIAESSCDLPTNSIESVSDRVLESLAETEEDTCLSNRDGVEGEQNILPNDDNIEKSFRVNHDGSMTVEMKVRLTIKEEETVKWTTTLTRSNAVDKLNVPFLPDSNPEQEVCSNDSQISANSTNIIQRNRTRDDDDPPSLGNRAFCDSFQEADDINDHTGEMQPRRAATPGCKKISKLQASVGSITSEDECGEGNMGSFLFREETENRKTTDLFYMGNQNSTKPVPKPRRLGSVDVNSGDICALTPTETMETEFIGEEVTETILHIYEQKTCHDNLLGNVGVYGMSASGAASESKCSINEFELGFWRCSPTSELGRTNSMFVTSDLDLGSPKAHATQRPKGEKLQQSKKSHNKPVEEDWRASSKPKLVGKHDRVFMTPGKRQRKSYRKGTEKGKKVKPFSSAVFIKKIYGNKTKPLKKLRKKGKSSWNSLPKPNAKHSNVKLSLKKNKSKQMFTTKTDTSHTKRGLKLQGKTESLHINKDRPLQQFNLSSSVGKESIENWLDKTILSPSSNQDQESKRLEGFAPIQTQKKVGRFSNETSETSKLLELPLPENAVVKVRVQSFENNLTSTVLKTEVSPKYANNYTANPNVANPNYNNLAQKNTQGKPLLNVICPEILPVKTETSESSEEGNFGTLSMQLPPPPPPEILSAEYLKNNPASVTSSPMSNQRSDNYTQSMSHSSDKAISPGDNTMEKTPAQSMNLIAQKGVESSINPSLNNATLASIWSKKATEESKILPVPNSTVENEISSAGMTQQFKTTSNDNQQPILELGTPSFCNSVSPLSLTSDGRMSSSSNASSVASVLGNIPFLESKRENESPKCLMKRAKLKSSPSPERKFHNKKSSEFQNTSPEHSPITRHLQGKKVISKKGQKRPETPSASPSTQRKHNETKEHQKSYPYSQSPDVVSPHGRQKPREKMLPGALFLDSASELKKRKPKNTSSQKESHQTAEIEADNSDEVRDATEQVTSMLPEQNMKPILEKICYSIKSIRKITKNKRPSCLEKSNSLPDFSSHVASTFGSSSKVLLAFLAVMTLKEGLTNPSIKKLNANNVSCAEALKMIDSLKEIANIEDSQRLRTSLSDLQQSASTQLLQTWRGFQELSNTEAELDTGEGPEIEARIGKNIIDEIIDNLDIPQNLKEELVSLSESTEGKQENQGNVDSVRLKLLTDHGNNKNKNIFSEDSVAQDVKQITIINRPKQSEMGRIAQFTKASKYNPMGPAAEENECQDWTNSVADPKSDPQEKQIYSTMSLTLQSCGNAANEGNMERQKPNQQTYLSEKATQKSAEISRDMCSETTLVKQGLYMDFRQLTQNEKYTLETELTHDAKLALHDETQIISANQFCCEQGTEKSTEVTHPEIIEEINVGSDLGSLSVEQQPSSNYYVEVNLTGNKTIFNSVSENMQESYPVEIKRKMLQSHMCNMGLDIRTDDSTRSLDIDDTSSEKEHSEVVCKKLQVIKEENLYCNEKEEEEPIGDLTKFAEQTKCKELEALTEEPEEDQISSEGEAQNTDELKLERYPERDLIDLSEHPKLCNKKEESSLIISEGLRKTFRFKVDNDSGNDHTSFEEYLDEDKQMSSLVEEQLNYYENDSSSETQKACKDRKIKDSNAKYQETPLREQVEESNDVKTVEKCHTDEVKTQSVAERVVLLEKQVAEAQKPKFAPPSSTIRHFSQRKSPLETKDYLSDSPTSELALCTRSAPQSSLSFSYDSSVVVTTEPEASRVRSIREMFLARSSTNVQQKGSMNPSSSELIAETSGSGYQSQTSSDLSITEDDTARKSISKGFVRKAIEMLYGKKDLETEETTERPPSEPDQRKREPSSIFSPFHAVRSKAMSELSYFNSSNALDIFSDATRCIAFNLQVGPGDSVPIDNERWLVRENTSMRKSVSDPAGINKNFTSTFSDDGFSKDTEEKTPYSLFSTKPELEDESKSQPGKCTYFSLPFASESEVCQEELSPVSKSSKNEGSAGETKDASEVSKTCAEINGTLPVIGVADFKMKNNKVHPLVELPPDGEVVVVQPGRGQGVVPRRIQEPDILDLLYTFCGEHCPIL